MVAFSLERVRRINPARISITGLYQEALRTAAPA
jgi:hypothetical protein